MGERPEGGGEEDEATIDPPQSNGNAWSRRRNRSRWVLGRHRFDPDLEREFDVLHYNYQSTHRRLGQRDDHGVFRRSEPGVHAR